MMSETAPDTMEAGAALAVIPAASLPTVLAADTNDILGIKQRMDALRDRVREPLAEYEAAEAARIKANEDAIAALDALVVGLEDLTCDEIAARQDSIQPFEWSIEFRARGARVTDAVMAQLRIAHRAARAREEAAEAEAQRQAEAAEAQRLADIEARRLHEERIATEAAERARAEAEEKAAREAREAEERAQATLRAAEEAAQAERDAAAEREREAAEALERSEREKLEAIEQAHRDRQAEAERARAAEDRARQLIREANERAERQRQQAEAQRVERERAIAERERLVAEEAEKQRKLAAEKAERDRKDAIEAERRRVADEAAARTAEFEKRAANLAHRESINREVVADLIAHAALTTDVAKAVVTAVAKNQVRHTAIDYAAEPTGKAGALL